MTDTTSSMPSTSSSSSPASSPSPASPQPAPAAAPPSFDARSAQAVARGLGWFSIALGTAQLLMPEMMTRATGTRGARTLMRLAGMREIAAGVGILASGDPRPWVWARVGGDALDAATLATQLRGGNPRATNTAVSLAVVAGVAALDVACARSLDDLAGPAEETRDYSGRRGLPLPPDEMRGMALEDFVVPKDLQIPHALAPYPAG
jgi:hypothetical protein